MNRRPFSAFLAFLFLTLPAIGFAVQDEKEGITIRGKISQGSERETFHVDLSKLTVRFLRRVVLPPAPIPENWATLDQAAREAWWKTFLESKPGKDYQANRKKLLETAVEYDAVVEQDGSFVVYDVIPGTYGMTTRLDKEIGPRSYAFELFGEIPVSEEADIIELGEKPLTITPIIRTGEPAASWDEASTLDGNKVSLKSLNGKYVLLNFWSSDDPSREFQKDIQLAYNQLKAKHDFELLSVSLDREKDNLVKFVKDQQLLGIHVHANRESRIARVFGVHSTPGLLLIGPDGMIKMTYPEMNQAYQAGKPSLDVILDDRITGKDTPAESDAKKSDEGNG